MKKKILITGGAGYIGSRLATSLAEDNYDLRIIDKARPEEHGNTIPENAEFLHGDLRDISWVKKAVQGIDTVVHLAANIGASGYLYKHQAEIIAENMTIDSLLYPAMIEAGVKTVVFSSSSMVFQNAANYPYKEEDLKTARIPTNIYGVSKLAGEAFCRGFNKQYGLNYALLRYHCVYGPGEDSKGTTPGEIHVICALIEKVLQGQYPIKLWGNSATATRTFIYVDDAVALTKQITQRAAEGDKAIINNDFNIGTGENIKITDLAKTIWELIGDGREFKYIIDPEDVDTANRREMSSQKIETILNWKPTVPLKDGIIKTAEWMRNRKK